MFLKEIPSTLLDAFREKRLVLFAGAGISVGSGLPTGRELAFQLQNELFKNGHVDVRPSPADSLQLDLVAQRYQVAFGRQKLNDTLLRIFQKDGLSPNEGHRLAVRLFQRIVTTNFDSLLEDAVKREGRAPIVVVRDVQLPNTSIPDRSVVYKLHGDISTPDRIVITQRDYVRVPLDDGIRSELRSILLTRGVVFVGYGLGDPDFLRQLDFCRAILGQEMPKSYALILGVEKDQLLVEQCSQDNIDVFSDTAVDFLQDLELAAQAYAGAAPKLPFAAPVETVTEESKEYRATVCEEFRWIEFAGIPVPGGYLRAEIDRLFVSLSAIPRQELAAAPVTATQGREGQGAAAARKPRLLKEVSEGRSLFEILKDHPKLVILGDPGSGKTTLLRYVAYHLALSPPQPMKIGLDKAYLPVYIPLRQYAAYLKGAQHPSIGNFLPEFLKAHNLGRYTAAVQSALRDGEAILLFDGLDEVASEEERLRVATQVTQFSAACPTCRLILTSRKVGYPHAPIKNGVAHFVVEPLGEPQIQTFIDLWCKETGTEGEKQSLVEAIRNPRVRALAENPLLITILARVYMAYRNLPERRAKLYAKCVEALLTTWDLVRELPPVFQDDREASRIMGPLALWIHRDCGGQFVSRDQLLGKLAEIGNLPRGQQPTAVLAQIEERSGLLREVGLNQYAFTHITFQEYYVAREVVSKGDTFKQLRKFLRNDRWQEVISLTAGLLDDLGRRPVTDFLDCLVAKPSFPTRPKPLQLAKLNLLIACLKDKVEPDRYILDYARKSLLSIVEMSGGVLHRIFDGLPQLGGLGKTPIGSDLITALENVLRTGKNIPQGENAILMGFNLFKDEQDRARFLLFAAKTAPVEVHLVSSAAFFVGRALAFTTDKTFLDEATKEIRTIPMERRRKIFEAGSYYPPDIFGPAVDFWFTPEERSTLPEKFRPRPARGAAPTA